MRNFHDKKKRHIPVPYKGLVSFSKFGKFTKKTQRKPRNNLLYSQVRNYKTYPVLGENVKVLLRRLVVNVNNRWLGNSHDAKLMFHN